MRSRFAILIALLVAGLSWLQGTLIGYDTSQRSRQEVGLHLAEISYMVIARLDHDVQSRAARLQVIGHLRVLRQPYNVADGVHFWSA
ncbi:hypothetical protein DBR00_08245 [Pseudomonas sp. HMWF032]|uniref:hypothetical protein n=1 Tax=Pseudomonas sp. HMWF032 TaxID=2056866 RepID=UPI000D35367B|nr:hypothetical protein [Pseudomonas sp. HMWF032]PTS85741.1 hypothetical protein DBR00_08245 [Pseudomonas sp. HMWF032]PTT85095.1 hypothetical protein DBR41_05335 [Pseudomonas sp. HMWF010]